MPAAFFGLEIFSDLPVSLKYICCRMSFYVLVVITPIVIGAWIYRVHVTAGSADESLRAVPLKPLGILLPRMGVVFLSWIRLMLPVLIIYFYGLFILMPSLFPHASEHVLVRTTIGWLYSSGLQYFIHAVPSWIARQVIMIFLGGLWGVGFVTVPIAWGFWWASRFRYSAAGYFSSFFMWVVLAVIIVLLIQSNYSFQVSAYGRHIFQSSDRIYRMATVQGFLWPVMTAVFIGMACYVVGRRSR